MCIGTVTPNLLYVWRFCLALKDNTIKAANRGFVIHFEVVGTFETVRDNPNTTQ